MSDPANVAEMMTAYADRSDKAAMASSNIADLLARQAAIEDKVAADQTALSEDAKLIAITAGAGELAAQAANQEAKKLLEGDVFDPASLKAQQLAEFVRRKREADVLLENIKQKQSVSFFDNPLEYIVNQMDMPTLVNQYNLTGTQANSALRTVNDIDSTLTNEANANKATAITKSQESIAATARLAANAYNLQAADAEFKSLSANIAANKIIDQGNATQIDMLDKQYQMLNNEETRKQRKLEYDMQKQRFDLWQKEHADTLEGKQYVRKLISTGMGVLGMNPPGEQQMQQYEQAYKTPEGRKQLQHILDAGQRKIFTGLTQIGTDPADALYTVASVGDYSKGKEYAPALGAIKNVADQLADPKNPRRVDPMKPGEFKPALNSAMKTIQTQWNLDPDNSPVYKAPTVERMAQVSIVAETPWFQKVLAPSVAAAKATGATIPQITGRAMYEQTLNAVNKGELTVEQASEGIATYYAMAGKVNAIKNGTVGIGPQEGYRVKLGATAFATGVDLANPVQVTAAMLAGNAAGLDDFIRATGTEKHVQFWTGYKPAPEGK